MGYKINATEVIGGNSGSRVANLNDLSLTSYSLAQLNSIGATATGDIAYCNDFTGGGAVVVWNGSSWISAIIPPVSGSAIFTQTGNKTWTCPANVYSVCVVCVGGGRPGYFVSGGSTGGGGGGLGYKNNITVVPGNNYTVKVGSTSQGQSYFISAQTVCGNGANGRQGGGYVGDGGGNGGQGGSGQRPGGGGAGGYSGNGGQASQGQGSNSQQANGSNGSGGGGGGGAGWNPSGGGGVGIFGEGTSGGLGRGTNNYSSNYDERSADGGSGGTGGGFDATGIALPGNFQAAILGGGSYGGGGGVGVDQVSQQWVEGPGATGAVRIIWGSNKSFPSNAS